MNFFKIFIFYCAISIPTISFANEDNGSLRSTYLPSEIASILKLEKGETPYLIAKYEPSEGSKYYIFDLISEQFMRSAFFKIEDNKATELGRDDEEPFPFSRFIQDPKAIDALWQDYLTRWIKRDGKEEIQKRLNLRSNEQITEEEATHFEQAGFKIPPTARKVKIYELPPIPSP